MTATDILDSLQRALASSYAVERELGRGGMATVYLARDLKHDRRVAVKVLHPDLAAALGAERFLTEIRTTANLQHPHILPLHDSGEADGLLYYVMPFVEGETLRAKLERGPLPIDEAVRLSREVLSALDYAHRHGVVHRDIKPENILLHDDAALVADFGIALAVQSASGPRMTQTGLSLGTPSYMSPEQAMGEKHIDGRADVYATGAMLYEMLSGDPPFSGSTVQAIVARVMTERPTSLRALRDTVPTAVDAAVHRALAKLPADRFATAAEFATALSAPDMPSVHSAGAAHPVGAGATRVGGRRVTYAGWAVAALLAVGLSGALLARHTPSSHSVVIQRQLTFTGDVSGVALSPDGLWLAYVRNNCLVHDAPPCMFTIEVREVDGSQSVRIGTWPSVSSDLRWTSDARIVFRAAEAGMPPSIRISDRLGGTPRRIPVRASAMAVVGDGRTLVAATGAAGQQWLRRYNLTTLAALDSAPLPPGVELVDLSASPTDGTLAAAAEFGGATSVIMLLDTSGRMLDTISVPSRPVVRWDSTATAVLVFDDAEAGGIGDDLLRVAVSGHRFERSAPTVLVGQLATYSQGRFDAALSGRFALSFGSDRMSLLTAPLPAATQWRTFFESTAFLGGIRMDVTPDGRGVIVAASDNLGENLYVVPLEGGALRALTAYRGGASDGARWAQDVRYSPNGEWMVFIRGIRGGQEVAIADSSGGREHNLTATTLGNTWQANWFGDDRIAVYRNHAIVLLDPTSVPRDSINVPDSLAVPLGSVLSRITDRTVFFWSSRARAIVGADFLQHATRVVVRSPDARLEPLAWDASGALLAISFDGSLSSTIVRIGADGSMTPVVKLPAGCLIAALNRTGTAIVCSRSDSRRDVWLGVAR